MLPTTNYQLPTVRKGFALIFVLLFATIALMVGSSIVVALISGSKLNRQIYQGAQAYLLARGGIAAAANELRLSEEKKPEWPTGTCADDKYHIYYKNGNKYIDLSENKNITELTAWIQGNSDAIKQGFYAVRLCYDDKEIESIGFFQGRKITLKGVIKKNPNPTPSLLHYNYIKPGNQLAEPPTVDQTKDGHCTLTGYPGATNCSDDPDYLQAEVKENDTKYYHLKELIKIYQTGS